MVLGCINRTARDTKLLLMAVLASLVGSYQFMQYTKGTTLLFESVNRLAPHPALLPLASPSPINSIHDTVLVQIFEERKFCYFTDHVHATKIYSLLLR